MVTTCVGEPVGLYLSTCYLMHGRAGVIFNAFVLVTCVESCYPEGAAVFRKGNESAGNRSGW